MTDKHWITDDATRRKFWTYVKGDLSMSEDEVHEALGVESIKDFDGDKAAAVALLKDFAISRARMGLNIQEPSHAEAKTIAFCDLYTPDGARVSLTAREGASQDSLVATVLALTDATKTLINSFNFSAAPQKYTPTRKQPAQPASTSPPIPSTPPPVSNTPPPSSAPSSTPPAGNGDVHVHSETFLVESITAQVSPNGNRYYAVRGGRVKKHGATAWPEIAEPQLEALTEYNPVNLEIGKPWDVTGFGIRAVGEIPAGKTYPNKVTTFVLS